MPRKTHTFRLPGFSRPAWAKTRFGKSYFLALGVLLVILGVEVGGVALLDRNRRQVSLKTETAEAASPTASPTPSSTPSPTPPSSPTVTPSVKGAASTKRSTRTTVRAATNVRYPSQILNLINWKLTLPVAGSGSDALEITQPALGTYTHSGYFHKLPDNSGVAFVANAGGATTGGSSYPRSELREMTNSGRSNASWSSTGGAHRMRLTVSINHLPVVKPEVVFAQIHDAEDDFIEAQITRESDGRNRLWVHHDGHQYGANLSDNYVLGSKFTLEIVAAGGWVDVYYNGALKVHQNLPSSGLYFKAGCYTQSNTDRGDAPDAYGEVRLYGLQLVHS